MPDLVLRDFAADRPGVKFVGDITYLATIIGCFSKKAVGTELVEDALKNAAATTVIEPSAIFLQRSRQRLHVGRLPQAHHRSGHAFLDGHTSVCWDNAMAESFFSALRNERVYRTVYPTKSQARRDIIAYIEGFYNSRRRHSAPGYQRPNDVHYGYIQPATAA